MKRAEGKVNKRIGFYFYFNFAKVYGEQRDWPNRVRCLRAALKYEPNQIMARHSLGVALGRMNEHEEAIKVFDGIIEHELERAIGPTDSLVIALRTKIISLRRMKKVKTARAAIDDVLQRLDKYPGLESIKLKVRELKNSEFTS